jgi:uncharacterized protein (TIGR02453 family)
MTLFGPEAAQFFVGIAEDNSKGFFDEHREVYTRAIRQPLEDLLAEAEENYGPGRIMRPNRDVRFSANKAPYRTDAAMWAGAVGGVYLNVSADGLEVGGGLYSPSRDQLDRARTAIASRPLVATQLSGVITALTGSGFTMAGPSLTTAPKGYDRDDPAIELLRLKHFAALRKLSGDATESDIRGTWKLVEPLIEWCGTVVGPALELPRS